MPPPPWTDYFCDAWPTMGTGMSDPLTPAAWRLTAEQNEQATVDFEAQDEAVLAKILVPAGTPDVAVGTPMMVLIESADDAAAFKDFSAGAAEAPAPAPAAAAVEEAPAAEPAPAPTAAAPAQAAPAAAPGARVAASPLAKLVSEWLRESLW